MFATTYREVKARFSSEQYQKLNEVCGALNLSQTEVLRRLISVCTPELIQDVCGVVPVHIEATFDNPLDHIEGMCNQHGLFDCEECNPNPAS